MADFDQAIKFVLPHEGPLEDDPRDPGGETCAGVTVSLLRELGEYGDIDDNGVIDANDIRALAPDWSAPDGKAAEVWRRALWDKFGYGEITSQRIANKLLDLAAVLGWPVAHRVLQRALTHMGFPVTDDGVIGPQTRHALALALGWGYEQHIYQAMCGEAMLVFGRILKAHPEMEYARGGWMSRAGE